MLRVQPIVFPPVPVAGRRDVAQPTRKSSRAKQASRLSASATALASRVLPPEPSPEAATTRASRHRDRPNVAHSGATPFRDGVFALHSQQSSHPPLAPPSDRVHPSATPPSISQLRKAISSLDSRVAVLLSERAKLERSLDQAVRFQAPIHRLPNEILSSIFATGLNGAEDEEALVLSNVMLVCRRWASVVQDTPVLWSQITISPQHSLSRAHDRLARSKSVPLDISIMFNPRRESFDARSSAVVAQALDLLVPQMQRWRSFRLALPDTIQTHSVLSRCNMPAPLLTTLHVRAFNTHHWPEEETASPLPLPLLMGLAPRLRECVLHSFPFDWSTLASLRTGLRVLDIGGYWSGVLPSVHSILDVLRACPELEELVLSNMTDIDLDSNTAFAYESCCGVQIPTQVITLPRLRKAKFCYAGAQRMRAVLSHLVFPALEEIDICYMGNVTLILPHLGRQALTSLPLRRLRIEQGSCDEIELFRLLTRTTSLTTLELNYVDGLSPSLFENLAKPAAQSWICPLLETLALDGCTALTFGTLRSFIEARLSPYARAYPHSTLPPTAASLPPVRTIHSSLDRESTLPPRSSRPIPISCRSQSTPPHGGTDVPGWPLRLQRLGLSRCHQFSREMIQWLRMYVPELKLDAERESPFP